MNLFALMLDLAIVGLLATTIAFAIRLNRQLATVRESKMELEELVRGFAEATERAEAGVEAMKRMAAEMGDTLQARIERGQAIRDELQFMIEAADSLATRLEGAIGAQRPAAGPVRGEAVPPQPPLTASRAGAPPKRAAAEPPPKAAPQPEARSRAERELMQALENLR